MGDIPPCKTVHTIAWMGYGALWYCFPRLTTASTAGYYLWLANRNYTAAEMYVGARMFFLGMPPATATVGTALTFGYLVMWWEYPRFVSAVTMLGWIAR